MSWLVLRNQVQRGGEKYSRPLVFADRAGRDSSCHTVLQSRRPRVRICRLSVSFGSDSTQLKRPAVEAPWLRHPISAPGFIKPGEVQFGNRHTKEADRSATP